MFILDSLMISGIRWALQTTLTAAEAEMNDDTTLRERLLEAEMRREMGEISDEEFRATEADLLARIREIRERREGTAPLALGAEPMHTAADGGFTVEAELSGDFHEPVEGTGAKRTAGSSRARRKAAPSQPEPAARTATRAKTAPRKKPAARAAGVDAGPAAARSGTRRLSGSSRPTRTTRTIKA